MLEIDAPQKVRFPIVSYPNFKLRSALIEKDPAIWKNLLLVYLQFLNYVITKQPELDDKSNQELCMFVKAYLHESADEQGKVITLGYTNPQLLENIQLLNESVHQLIVNMGVLLLQLNAASLWDLIKVYDVHSRSIIDGSHKSRALNYTHQVHKHIEFLISSGKFTKIDLDKLAVTLGRYSKKSKNKFAEQFVTVQWLETLDRLYMDGQGVHAAMAKKVGVVCVLAVSPSKAASLATEMGINGLNSLKLYPLFGGIIYSPSYRQMVPGLEQRLPFLKIAVTKSNEQDIQTILDIFPHLTHSQVSTLLETRDVETLTNDLFENPDLAGEKLPERRNVFKEPLQKEVKKKVEQVPDQLKNKTLEAALSLIYQKDEDERDDTYDESEASIQPGLMSISEEGDVSSTKEHQESATDKIEPYLWDLYKKDASNFSKTQRKQRMRKEMRSTTGWTDEQIEGWARMIERSPQRAQVLEEKYMFRGNVRGGGTAYRRMKNEDGEEEVVKVQQQRRPVAHKGPVDQKKQYARNEKNKSSAANHNRKRGHDKKMSKAGPPPA